MVHGTADTLMPYGGGCVANLGGACNRGRVISAEATRDWWLNSNGLSGVAPTSSSVNLDTTDGGVTNRFVYSGSVPVEWWRLDGAGHTAASRLVLVPTNSDRGIQNRDIEFAEVAWSFFKSRLVTATSTPPSTSALQTARDYNFAVGGQTLIVMHNGTVIEESYGNGGSSDRIQLLASGTKGLTGMLGALAASEGLIALDEPVAQRAITEWQGDALKSRITFRHLLTMTSGLEELNNLSGWNGYLQARLINDPGSTFIYSGDPNIFALALERRLSGESVADYMNRKLLQPLDINSLRWGNQFYRRQAKPFRWCIPYSARLGKIWRIHPQDDGGKLDWSLFAAKGVFRSGICRNCRASGIRVLLVAQTTGVPGSCCHDRYEQHEPIYEADQADHR